MYMVFRNSVFQSRKLLQKEIEKVKELGVKFETNVVIGKSTTIDQLMEEEELRSCIYRIRSRTSECLWEFQERTANGVFSANEYLTRSNLMKAFDDSYDTPICSRQESCSCRWW